jgi:hypothetical protein
MEIIGVIKMERIPISCQLEVDDIQLYAWIKVYVLTKTIPERHNIGTFYSYEVDLDELSEALELNRELLEREGYDVDKIIGELHSYDKQIALSASGGKKSGDSVIITFYLTILPVKRLIVLSGRVVVA